MKKLTQQEYTNLSLPPRMSFEALRKGDATEIDFHTVAYAINIAAIRCERINEQAREAITKAQDALIRSVIRFRKTKTWGLDGPARQEIDCGLDIWERLLKMLDAKQVLYDIKQVNQRLKAGNAIEFRGMSYD